MSSTRTKVYLLGSLEDSITGAKLPSRKQVLHFFLNQHLKNKVPMKEAARETLKVVAEFWERANIPMKHPQRAKQNIIDLYKTSQSQTGYDSD